MGRVIILQGCSINTGRTGMGTDGIQDSVSLWDSEYSETCLHKALLKWKRLEGRSSVLVSWLHL